MDTLFWNPDRLEELFRHLGGEENARRLVAGTCTCKLSTSVSPAFTVQLDQRHTFAGARALCPHVFLSIADGITDVRYPTAAECEGPEELVLVQSGSVEPSTKDMREALVRDGLAFPTPAHLLALVDVLPALKEKLTAEESGKNLAILLAHPTEDKQVRVDSVLQWFNWQNGGLLAESDVTRSWHAKEYRFLAVRRRKNGCPSTPR